MMAHVSAATVASERNEVLPKNRANATESARSDYSYNKADTGEETKEGSS
jgi:hypothetical protein